MRLTVLLLLLVEFATAGASGEGESDKAKSIHLSLGSVEFEAGEPKSSYHSWQSESTHGFPASGWFKPLKR